MYRCECHCQNCHDRYEVRADDPQQVSDGEKVCPICATPLMLDDYYDEDDIPVSEE